MSDQTGLKVKSDNLLWMEVVQNFQIIEFK
jgi:hypothetical protein